MERSCGPVRALWASLYELPPNKPLYEHFVLRAALRSLKSDVRCRGGVNPRPYIGTLTPDARRLKPFLTRTNQTN
jgi:hypothetical protein